MVFHLILELYSTCCHQLQQLSAEHHLGQCIRHHWLCRHQYDPSQTACDAGLSVCQHKTGGTCPAGLMSSLLWGSRSPGNQCRHPLVEMELLVLVVLQVFEALASYLGVRSRPISSWLALRCPGLPLLPVSLHETWSMRSFSIFHHEHRGCVPSHRSSSQRLPSRWWYESPCWSPSGLAWASPSLLLGCMLFPLSLTKRHGPPPASTWCPWGSVCR